MQRVNIESNLSLVANTIQRDFPGFRAAGDPFHTHDIHASLLELMGSTTRCSHS